MGYGKYVGNNSRLFDDSFTMNFINYGNKIIHCAMYFLYISYINESTNFAESLGGSGDTKDWGHEKDEDKIEWIRRCLRQATKMWRKN